MGRWHVEDAPLKQTGRTHRIKENNQRTIPGGEIARRTRAENKESLLLQFRTNRIRKTTPESYTHKFKAIKAYVEKVTIKKLRIRRKIKPVTL
jgi:hypothetical protein